MASVSPGPAPPPGAWEEVWLSAAEELAALRNQRAFPPVLQVLRVNQEKHDSLTSSYQLQKEVDARRLDVEMTGMLREQLLKVLSFLRPGILSRYEPELNLVLEALVFRFSIWVDRPTPGNALMNLRYRNEHAVRRGEVGPVRTGLEGPGLTRSQKVLYAAALIGGRYAWLRLNSTSALQRWGDRDRERSGRRWFEIDPDVESGQTTWANRGWRLLLWIEKSYRLLAFLNLLHFLRTGKYRNPVEAVLGTRLVYDRPTMSRQVSFEYMNRQLVWHEFSELLLLLLPLLSLSSIKSTLLAPFQSSGQNMATSLPQESCAICRTSTIAVPYTAVPCNHMFCYYCLSTHAAAQANYKCPRCLTEVEAMQRHQPKGLLSDT